MPSEEKYAISGKQLLLMSIASGVVYVIITWLIYTFLHRQPIDLAFASPTSITEEVVSGILFGIISAAIIGSLLMKTPLSGILHDFAIVEFVSRARLSWFDRVQVSAVAGFGEELLFRGAIQPLLGVWLTSLIFIALHGYFKFKTIYHMLFGVLMFSLSLGLGFLYEYVGLIAAMIAHAVYDLIMLAAVQRWERRNGEL